MSDHDIRRALAILAADYDPDGAPDEVAEEARRFAEAIEQARWIPPSVRAAAPRV